MTLYRLVVLSFCLSIEQCDTCIYGLLELPSRPKSISNFQLPSFDDSKLPETAMEFCTSAKKLNVSAPCRNGISNVACALANLFEAKLTNCDDTNDIKRCEECSNETQHRIRSNFWSLKWLDSIGKMPCAIGEGNYYWLGSYEQCIELKTTDQFDGKYCRIQFNLVDTSSKSEQCGTDQSIPIHIGICMPYECSLEEITHLLRSFLLLKIDLRCESPFQWSISSKIFLSAVIFWLFILICATFIDNYLCNNYSCTNTSLTILARSLSLRQNGAEAISTKRQHKFHALQGMQVMSIVAILTANTYYYMMPFIENVYFSYDNVHSIIFHPLNNFTYHVDGIISMNTVFTAIILLKSIRTTDDIKLAYFKRLVQVLPSVAFIIAFMILIFEKLSNGPLWIHGELISRCSNSWWKNLLFINNLFPVSDSCLDYNYLFALEAQFFIILGPMVYFVVRYYKPVIITSFLILLASMVYNFYASYSNSILPTIMLTEHLITSSDYELYINTLFLKPWMRAPSFLIGFLSSFLFVKKIEPNRVVSTILWLGIVAATLWVTFFLYWYPQNFPSKSISFYAAVHRPLWSLAICLITFLCYDKSGGHLATFLEWRLFVPLAKLTYTVILICQPISLYLFASLNRPSHATHWSTLYVALGTIALCYLISLIVDIAIARPIRKVSAFLVNRWQAKPVNANPAESSI